VSEETALVKQLNHVARHRLVTYVGLTVSDKRLTRGDVEALIVWTKNMSSMNNWVIGDLADVLTRRAKHGSKHDVIAHLADQLDISYGHVANCMAVCRRFPIETEHRLQGRYVTFTYYLASMVLPPDQQFDLLVQAEESELSLPQFIAKVYEARGRNLTTSESWDKSSGRVRQGEGFTGEELYAVEQWMYGFDLTFRKETENRVEVRNGTQRTVIESDTPLRVSFLDATGG